MKRLRSLTSRARSSEPSSINSEASSLLSSLPQHFATAYVYIDNTPSGSTRSPRFEESEGLRRSSRCRKERLSQLERTSEDENQSDRKTRSADRSGLSTSSSRRAGPSSPRKRIKRTRDDPNSEAGSIYAHLKGLPDLFAVDNDIMFCGINPGVKSSHSGHHFAHRSNHFYPSLHLSGITQQRMKPEQDVDFPTLRPMSLGLTNLAGRPTAEGSELLPSELIAGVPVLLEKVQVWRPRTVCFVGKGISEAFVKGLKQAGAIPSARRESKQRSGAKAEAQDQDTLGHTVLDIQIPAEVLRADSGGAKPSSQRKPAPGSPKAKRLHYTKDSAKDDSGYGLLPICVSHAKRTDRPLRLDEVTLFFVSPSSSARVTTHFLDDKARILSGLRVLVEHLKSAPASVVGRKYDTMKDEPGQAQQEPSEGASTKRVELQMVDLTAFGLRVGGIKPEVKQESPSFS